MGHKCQVHVLRFGGVRHTTCDRLYARGNAAADCIARWDGSFWHALGSGLNDAVTATAGVGSNVYVGGIFTNAGEDTRPTASLAGER
jgi:hypothetical protein